MKSLAFIVVFVFASSAVASPNYYEMAGEIPEETAVEESHAEAIKLGTRAVMTSGVADYGMMFLEQRQQPAAPADCPDGLCPYPAPVQQMIRTAPTRYTAAEQPACGASEYAAEAACGGASYAKARSARQETRLERRMARRSLVAKSVLRPLRRLRSRC